MEFFEGLGASARDALGWSDDGDDAYDLPALQTSFGVPILSHPLERIEVTVATAGDAVTARLTVAGGEVGPLAGVGFGWSCSHEGVYEHEGALELPLSAADGTSAAASCNSSGGAACAVRYEHPQGLSAAQFGVDGEVSTGGGWVVPSRLSYAAGWRRGPLAAGLKGVVEMADTETDPLRMLAPQARLGFDDEVVSVHFFAEGQPSYTGVGGCCQWRPPLTPSCRLSCGLRHALEVEAGSRGKEYSLAVDEGVIAVDYTVDDTLTTRVRVRRCFGEAATAEKSALQYGVRKQLAPGFTIGLLWQSPLATMARYGAHRYAFSVTAEP